MQRKKVLFLITKSNWGGAQRYVYDLATSLDSARYEPVVALGGNGALRQKLDEAGIRTILLNAAQRNISITKELFFALELWRILQSERPDVFHVNSSKAGGLGCFIGRLARVPRIIFTAHGWAFNEDRPWWQKFIIKKLHWWTIVFSHHTISVSRGLKLQMEWPLVQNKMSVINPGRSNIHFQSKLIARQTIARECDSLTPYIADVWIMTIAELHPIKQHSLLFESMLEILPTFPKVRLVCIGDGELRTVLNEQIIANNLQNNIYLTGPIHEAARLLKAADLFVLPSQSESYGYVLHEAGLAEVPIITTNVGGVTDIITDKSTGTLVPPCNAEHLTNALAAFLDQPQTYNQMATNLKSELQNRTIECMTEQTVRIYETDSSTATSSS